MSSYLKLYVCLVPIFQSLSEICDLNISKVAVVKGKASIQKRTIENIYCQLYKPKLTGVNESEVEK